ncbi:NACHT domain-containing protein [Lelliottia amnigena]|uniref:NACHT domain-containing protein n=1 Tax=Lelliottia amnigena TaxID=61646 RepID=UPI00293C0794|nr:hypothetical protein [Lelliottia amnigena]
MISIESVISLAKPWALKVIEEKFIPFIYSKGFSFYLRGRDLAKIKSLMSEYLAKTKAQCSTINSLAFPNVLKKINDIYEPLTLCSLDNGEYLSERVVNGEVLLDKYKHLLIIDNAGMGKSTLLKKIVIDTIEHSQYIPIYIELRSLEDKPIDEHIKLMFGIEAIESNDLLKQFPFAFFFDGVDEIQFDRKIAIIKRIKKFSEDFVNSNIIITSRPDQSLLELHSYSRFKIKPLELSQSYSLLKLYDANSYNIGNSLFLSKKLISEIELIRNKDSISILEFLTTPLYVSLLFCSYKYKPVIPRRKDLFYSQVFEALFETHDLSKETGYVRKKKSGLDITEFSILLRRLAFWCLKNNGKLEFSRSEFEMVMSEISSKLKGITFKPDYFINDLIYAVPIFIKEGALFRWSHKSLMEYFCAEFICIDVKDKREDLLLKIYESNSSLKYKNILELCSDIDYNSFRKSVLRKCLQDYSSHYHNVIENLKINNSDKEIWSCVTFFSDVTMMLTSYSNTNLSDFDVNPEEREIASAFENTFIGFRDYLTHITYPVTLRNTVFEILRWRHNEYFYKEKDFYQRSDVELISIPENVTIHCNNGYVENSSEDIIPELISVLLQFRHTLSIPIIRYLSTEKVLLDIYSDKSNGVDSLLEGF